MTRLTRRATRRTRAHIAGRGLPNDAAFANAFISRDGLWKRLWRLSNNPIAPRKFPTAVSTLAEGLLRCFFPLARNPAPMRSRCTVAMRAECADVECQPHRVARLQAPGLGGPEKNIGQLKPRTIFSVLTRRDAYQRPALVIGLGHGLRLGGSRRRFAAECRL
jgi:hypothetical protein